MADAAEPTLRAPSRPAWRLAAFAVALVIVGFALWTMRGEWRAAMAIAGDLQPRWPRLIASGGIVLAAYGVLIWTWRECLRDAGESLPVGTATHIWFVSNLARYVPGALWQIGALAVLAKRAGATASGATSSAIALTIINTLCGGIIVVALGADLLRGWAFSLWQPVLAVVAIVLLRWAVPPIVARLQANRAERLALPALGGRMLAASIGGSAVAWVLYGLAFQQLVQSLLPALSIPVHTAVAIYAASYLAGFLSLGPPAGLGVADGALIALLTTTSIATVGEAAVIATVARVWRTALEVLPGLVLLARQSTRGNRIP